MGSRFLLFRKGTIVMIASSLYLSRTDMIALKIKDSYSIHRVVYDLYEDIRAEQQIFPIEKESYKENGILYAEIGGNWKKQQILILANRFPRTPVHGQIESKIILPSFLQHDNYNFQVIVNPIKHWNPLKYEDTNRGKKPQIIPILGHKAITEWFINKAPKSWGFNVKAENIELRDIGPKIFNKGGKIIKHHSATIRGRLSVTDRDLFIKSFQYGVGRSRAFGFGLLQLVPLISKNKI